MNIFMHEAIVVKGKVHTLAHLHVFFLNQMWQVDYTLCPHICLTYPAILRSLYTAEYKMGKEANASMSHLDKALAYCCLFKGHVKNFVFFTVKATILNFIQWMFIQEDEMLSLLMRFCHFFY